MVKTLSCGLRDSGSIPGRGNFFYLFFLLLQLRPLACKVLSDDTFYWNDATLTFLASYIPFPWYVRADLTDAWPYGRVFVTSSGCHGEFITPKDPTVSLIYLGENILEALSMMQRLTNQHEYLLSLKELQ